MKRLVMAVCAFLLSINFASAQLSGGLMFPGPGAPAAAGGTPFSITEIGTASTTTGSTTTLTFASQNIGTPDPTRIVVVTIGHGPNTTTVSGVTIGGVAASQATGASVSSTGGTNSDIWYLAVPTGATATIAVTTLATESRMVIGVYNVIGTGSGFSTANNSFVSTGGTSLSTTVTVPAGGGAIVNMITHNTGITITPTNYTADVAGLVVGSSTTQLGHDTSHSGSTAYGTSWGVGTDAAMSVATFTP